MQTTWEGGGEVVVRWIGGGEVVMGRRGDGEVAAKQTRWW